MKQIFAFFTIITWMGACSADEQLKLKNERKAFDATMNYLTAAYTQWPAVLDKDEAVCNLVRKDDCVRLINQALDTIALRRREYNAYHPHFTALRNHWEQFKAKPAIEQNYHDFLILCRELDSVEQVMDGWGTSVANAMDKVNRGCILSMR